MNRGRDRHFDNILVKDGNEVMHIDFTYILGCGPPLDAPPIALALEMEQAFRELGVWNMFVDLCGSAFACARRNFSSVLRVASNAFSRTGIEAGQMSRFLRSKRSLYLSTDDISARDYVERQIHKGASDPQTWLKRIAHEVVDPTWYGLLRKGFPPAVAVMSWLDKGEKAALKNLAEELMSEEDLQTGELVEVNE